MANIKFDHAHPYFTLENTFPGSLNEIDRAIAMKSGNTIPPSCWSGQNEVICPSIKKSMLKPT